MASYNPESALPIDDGEGIEALTNDIDLHSTLATQVGIIGEEEREISPDNSLDSSNTINFTINSSLNYLIKPESIFLCGTFKITDGEGKDIPDQVLQNGNMIPNPASRVLPVNYTPGTVFKSCTVKLNDTVIEEGNTLHAYRANLEERLFQNAAVKRSQNYLRGFMPDKKAFEDLSNADKGQIWARTDTQF